MQIKGCWGVNNQRLEGEACGSSSRHVDECEMLCGEEQSQTVQDLKLALT